MSHRRPGPLPATIPAPPTSALSAGIAGAQPFESRLVSRALRARRAVPRVSSGQARELPGVFAQLLLVQGPMARHVRDLRVAYEVMAGPDPRDPWSVPAPLQGPPLPWPVRVAVVTDPEGLGVDAGIAA